MPISPDFDRCCPNCEISGKSRQKKKVSKPVLIRGKQTNNLSGRCIVLCSALAPFYFRESAHSGDVTGQILAQKVYLQQLRLAGFFYDIFPSEITLFSFVMCHLDIIICQFDKHGGNVASFCILTGLPPPPGDVDCLFTTRASLMISLAISLTSRRCWNAISGRSRYSSDRPAVGGNMSFKLNPCEHQSLHQLHQVKMSVKALDAQNPI